MAAIAQYYFDLSFDWTKLEGDCLQLNSTVWERFRYQNLVGLTWEQFRYQNLVGLTVWEQFRYQNLVGLTWEQFLYQNLLVIRYV